MSKEKEKFHIQAVLLLLTFDTIPQENQYTIHWNRSKIHNINVPVSAINDEKATQYWDKIIL